jgi:hypothetical protein
MAATRHSVAVIPVLTERAAVATAAHTATGVAPAEVTTIDSDTWVEDLAHAAAVAEAARATTVVVASTVGAAINPEADVHRLAPWASVAIVADAPATTGTQ